MCAHGLHIVGLIFRLFLLCFLAEHILPRNLGSTPLRDSYLCIGVCCCHFRAIFETGCVLCGSCSWRCLPGSLRLPKCLGPEEKESVAPSCSCVGCSSLCSLLVLGSCLFYLKPFLCFAVHIFNNELSESPGLGARNLSYIRSRTHTFQTTPGRPSVLVPRQ